MPLGEVRSGGFSEEATGGWVEAETPGSEGRLGRVAPAHPALLPRGPATGAKGSLVPLAWRPTVGLWNKIGQVRHRPPAQSPSLCPALPAGSSSSFVTCHSWVL